MDFVILAAISSVGVWVGSKVSGHVLSFLPQSIGGTKGVAAGAKPSSPELSMVMAVVVAGTIIAATIAVAGKISPRVSKAEKGAV